MSEVISNGSAALDADWLDREGVGGHISTDEPFLLVSQHPVTTEYGQAEHQINETLMALDELKMPTVMLWPNVDAGSEDVSRGMRKFRERYKPEYIRFYKNFPVETYLRLMRSAACLVGNSSASIREGAFIGTPAVNIGSRQDGRERGPNVVDVGYDRAAIAAAIRTQVKHGPYPAGAPLRRREGRCAHRRPAVDGAAARPEADSVPERPRCDSRARRIQRDSAEEPRARSRGGRCWPIRPTPRGRSRRLTRVVISTEDEEIAGVARQLGVDVPFLRPAHLAADETPMLDVLTDLVALARAARAVPARRPRSAAAHLALPPRRPHRRGGRSADFLGRRFGRHGGARSPSIHAVVADAVAGRSARAVERRSA